MAKELSYVLITPYTLVKSRSGGILSRLISRLDLDIVAAQIFSCSKELADEYAQAVYSNACGTNPFSAELLRDYIRGNLAPSEGREHRVALYLFYGENACKKLTRVSGALFPEARTEDFISGETIRDTYADLIIDKESNRVSYFEPAVLTPPNQIQAAKILGIFCKHIKGRENVVKNVKYPSHLNVARTLVIIKPDNWIKPSSKPGAIIDLFARTGLRIVGMKIFKMSVEAALEFYSGVKKVLDEKVGYHKAKPQVDALENRLHLRFSEDERNRLEEIIAKTVARDQYYEIVRFMSGRRPDKMTTEEMSDSGSVKSMLLIYEGEDAVKKIREVLGPTDPTQAPGGTVRSEFGQDIMINTAHASDSVESAEREFKIVDIENNPLCAIVEEFLECGECIENKKW